MAITKKADKSKPADRHQTAAFVNWVIKNPETGKVVLKSTRGLALQGNPAYPNKVEDALIAKATKCGGSFKTVMEVSINLNHKNEISLEDIPVLEDAA